MGRPKKDKEPSAAEIAKAEQEKALAEERDRILNEMSDGDLTEAQTQQLLRANRKYAIANLLAMQSRGDPKQREWATKELIAQDLGKAGTKKRSDADEVGVVIMRPGKYGIPA